jgi:hypothetical protein
MYVGVIHPVCFHSEQYLKNNNPFLKLGFISQQIFKNKKYEPQKNFWRVTYCPWNR